MIYVHSRYSWSKYVPSPKRESQVGTSTELLCFNPSFMARRCAVRDPSSNKEIHVDSAQPPPTVRTTTVCAFKCHPLVAIWRSMTWVFGRKPRQKETHSFSISHSSGSIPDSGSYLGFRECRLHKNYAAFRHEETINGWLFSHAKWRASGVASFRLSTKTIARQDDQLGFRAPGGMRSTRHVFLLMNGTVDGSNPTPPGTYKTM